MFREFLVGQCLWQAGQMKPPVSRCFASMWHLNRCLTLERKSHLGHWKVPSGNSTTILLITASRSKLKENFIEQNGGSGICVCLKSFWWGNVSDRWDTQNQRSAGAWLPREHAQLRRDLRWSRILNTHNWNQDAERHAAWLPRSPHLRHVAWLPCSTHLREEGEFLHFQSFIHCACNAFYGYAMHF